MWGVTFIIWQKLSRPCRATAYRYIYENAGWYWARMGNKGNEIVLWKVWAWKWLTFVNQLLARTNGLLTSATYCETPPPARLCYLVMPLHEWFSENVCFRHERQTPRIIPWPCRVAAPWRPFYSDIWNAEDCIRRIFEEVHGANVMQDCGVWLIVDYQTINCDFVFIKHCFNYSKQ